MAGTYVKARFHVVWSTKARQHLLTSAIRPRLWGYFNRVVQDHGGILFDAGGFTDHVHLYVECPKTMAIADLVSIVKTTSSKWLRLTFDDCKGFRWQAGYAAFSVSPVGDGRLRQYIRNQEIHHNAQRFDDEYRRFLELNGATYQVRYLLD